MAYTPSTDFLALLRSTGGGVRTEQMPGLNYVIQALARVGLISVAISYTAPTINQSSTAWFRPSSPSWSAEGVLYLWNSAVGAYQPAAPTLWAELLATYTSPLVPGVIPCTATGADAVVLTPFAGMPAITAYTDSSPILSWTQQTTNTAAATVQVGSLPALAAYRNNGAILIGPGDLVGGLAYTATRVSSLNSGAGGWVVNAAYQQPAALYATQAVAAASVIPATTQFLITGGFATVGDYGDAMYGHASSLQPGGFQSVDGQFWQNISPVLRPEMFSSSLTTTAIQAAINWADAVGVGEVRLRSANYRAVVQTGKNYCLNLTGSVSLIGEAPYLGAGTPSGSIISWGSEVGNTDDICLWSATALTQGAKITGIAWLADGFSSFTTTYGRHIIHAQGNGIYWHQVCEISDCYLTTSTGNAIFIDNAISDNNWQNCNIRDNIIFGGIKGVNVLDNSTIERNTFFNYSKVGMELTFAGGAANGTIRHNHGTSNYEALILHAGISMHIENNYFEMIAAFGGTTGYLYTLIGDTGPLTCGSFTGNICSQLGSWGLTGLVYFNNAAGWEVSGNYLNNGAGSPIAGINFDIGCTRCIIGGNFIVSGSGTFTSTNPNTPGIVLTGTTSQVAAQAPVGYDVPLTPVNSWVANGEVLSVRKERTGLCHLFGDLASGTTTSTTVVTVLPAGYRPLSAVYRMVYSAGNAIPIEIDTSGNVTIQAVAGASLTFGVSFAAPVT